MIKSYFFYLSHFSIIFFLNIYIANHYLAEIYGEYQYYTILFTFLLAFSQSGTLQSFTVLAPRVINSIKLIYATLIIRVIGYIIVTILLLIIFKILNMPIISYIFLLWFLPLTINLASILDYHDKMDIDVKYNLVFDGLFFSILSLFIIENNGSISLIIIARFFSKATAEYFKFKYIKTHLGLKKISKKYIIWMFQKSKVFILNRVIVEMYARSEILLLGIIASQKEVGLYAVAYTINNAILVGEGLLSRKLFPKLTKVFQSDLESKKILTISIIYKSIYFVSAIILTYSILNKLVFTYLYNSTEYRMSSIILNIMIIGLISHIFSNNTNYLLMMKDKSLYSKRFSIGLILNIVLGYYFYNYYELEGYTLAIQLVKIVMIMYSVYISYSFLNRKIKGCQVEK